MDTPQALYSRPYAAGRSYLCAAVRQARGTCNARHIPADVAEAQVLARLTTFVGDVEQWIANRATESDGERSLFEKALQDQRAELLRVSRRVARAQAQHDRLLDEGEDELAARALRELARIDGERDQLAHALTQAEARLSEWETPDVDAALDYYNELREAITGRVSNARSIRDLNAALATVLEGIWLHTVSDDELGDVLIAQFVLRGTSDAGQPPGITLATRVGHWRRILDEGESILPADDDPGTTVTSIAIPPMRVPLGDKERA